MAVQVVECPRDPGVETALRCSRCETPICPRCLVQSPVGARCKDCARVMKNPLYQLSGGQLARAVGAAVVGGVVMGIIWLVVLLPLGAFGLFFSIFLGVGLSWVFTKAMDWSTRRKRGPVVISLAVAGMLIAWGIQLLFLPWGFVAPGLLAVGIGAYLSYQNLK
jgi:hypothetical protein